ncbi:hypothetical protein EMIHUDRAFT_457950 [Emiliania huxleyi CCMP1516]|uniref:Uncharacterized protein n=2 Tax=Emiliania huxleyi TaxID=2903 RepID=A0A0D3JJG6_EMIH1|nr:hypothetical protein EMIHUDRAFT_457950 [Emiliania huxleyi CCMP1516]EOD23651.1 hypothetical protein EMIHUDRAFT_457950 [Emiliania huxleyi CCMP1516]|eukprot:XP_005776080.1 hypothetical protein EMIHUDRAFT_457950 [Emiliania huxleyi CCMP1516]
MYAAQQLLMCGALSHAQASLAEPAASVLQLPASPPLLLAPFLLLLFCAPSARLLALSLALSLGIILRKMPFYVVFYACTALWKVNAAFLDASVSCAPIFFAQLLDAYDMMASTMFANLRVYSGSNHGILPTGLLFGALPALDGGAAAWVTHLLSPTARRHLLASGHSARQFGPYMARVLGPQALRRLLAEARAAGEAFDLTYRRRESPDGRWRRVRYARRRDGRETCVALGRWPKGSRCKAEERALLTTAPPAWAMKLLLFFPFPVRLEEKMGVESKELGCVC